MLPQSSLQLFRTKCSWNSQVTGLLRHGFF
jgi:hypothetical protein